MTSRGTSVRDDLETILKASRPRTRLQSGTIQRATYGRFRTRLPSEDEESDAGSAVASDNTVSSEGQPREALMISAEQIAKVIEDALTKQQETFSWQTSATAAATGTATAHTAGNERHKQSPTHWHSGPRSKSLWRARFPKTILLQDEEVPAFLNICMKQQIQAASNRGSGGETVWPSSQYTSVKPLGDRVLVKIKSSEEKTTGGILLPTTAQTKPQSGEVVEIGDGRTVGKNKVDISIQAGAQIVYSKYAGTELEFNGTNHLLLKEDDIVGILDTDDFKDLKPLNDRVLIKVAQAEEKTAGGLLLTDAAKEKPSIGTVVAVGPGPLDEEGNRKPLSLTPGSTVLYSKYAGSEFKSGDGSEYIALRASDVIAVLSS
ncbi:20 kDa chaperonin, chloroplastic-like [Asparagus officinalis]|uniref:20 kDa chaperonin, chloroplastic-like n=1 Tax=Asparagus officinalis TaxID=4686 RepID=UPI00098E0CD8|nr:20 kDa chaperonin, chloroplastic-like [Asparagus officinalis]